MRPHTAGPRRRPARRDKRGRNPTGRRAKLRWSPMARLQVEAIRANGYGFRVVDYVEDARTPGLLGAGGGVTDHDHREVKISRVVIGRSFGGNPEPVLWHELRHVENRAWDCGTGYVWPGRREKGRAEALPILLEER